MGFLSSAFSNLTLSVSRGLVDDGVRAAFNTADYLMRGSDGKLKFISARGYDNVWVYAAKRTAMQAAFATLNDLYPSYVRQQERARMRLAYNKGQGSTLQKIIEDGRKADEEKTSGKVTVRYMGRPAPEALVLWIKNGSDTPQDIDLDTYWDKVSGLSHEEASSSSSLAKTVAKVPADKDKVFIDLGPLVQASSESNLILTKVQGRDYSRKELVSAGDIMFTVTGKIASNYPDVYPYAAVSRFVTLMRHPGVLQASNLMFGRFNVTQIAIRSFSMSQESGCINIQPYTFTCVGVEPDKDIEVAQDTIHQVDLYIGASKKSGWKKMLLDQVKAAAADQAAHMIEQLTANTI